jgi:hypothetical protein
MSTEDHNIRVETNRSSIVRGEGSTGRRSKNVRDEIMQQRMATTVRLENMNMKVPEQWRAAFMKAREGAKFNAQSPRQQ